LHSVVVFYFQFIVFFSSSRFIFRFPRVLSPFRGRWWISTSMTLGNYAGWSLYTPGRASQVLYFKSPGASLYTWPNVEKGNELYNYFLS